MHALLANAGITFAFTAGANVHGALDRVTVVETERNLVLERTKIAHVHGRIDRGQALALEDAAEQGLTARPVLGGVDVELVEQRSGLGNTGNVGGLFA